MRINVTKEALAALATAAAFIATPALAQQTQTATIDQSITNNEYNEYDQRTYNTTNEYDQRSYTTNEYDQRTTNEYDQRTYNTTNEYDQRDYSTHVSNDSASHSSVGDISVGGSHASGGNASNEFEQTIDASTHIADGAIRSDVTNNIGGAEIDNRDYSQVNVGGTEIDGRSYTDVTTGPTNVDVTTGPTNVDASIHEGAITNNIGGAEIDGRSYTDVANNQTVGDTNVSVGGAEIDNRDYSSNTQTVGDTNVTNEIDARNQQQIDASNAGNNSEQNVTNEIDARNSGNNAQQTQQNSGNSTNNIDASNHSIYRGASAANIPQAASMFALKACVGSTSIGIGGGSVYGLYGGISFNHTGSGAVNVTFEGPDGEEMAVTIPELSDMSPRSRAYALSGLNEKGQKLAMCLTSQFDAAKRQMEIDYKKALGIATVNAQAGVSIAEINSHRDQSVAQIRAASDNLQIAMTHNCGLGIRSRGGNHPQEIATGGSAPANRHFEDGSLTEHGFCYETGAQMADVISGERERPTTPVYETPALEARRAPVFDLDM